ncbi:MAG: hypothetical protein GY699_02570 [Desulfobacteraceae bacterium]|nr:hypothetical protein [Desulfobacteraceae bacterium]
MKTSLSIIRLNQKEQLWAFFFNLTTDIYKDDPCYCKPSIRSLQQNIQRPDLIDNQLPLLILEGGAPIARMIVRISNHSGLNNDKVGLFGFFEAKNRPDAVKLLFDEGARWLERKGIKQIIGPMDGDTWHKYRLNVGPYDEPPFMMEPQNPTYYPQLWEEYGFTVLARYVSKRVPDVGKILPGLKKRYDLAQKKGFTFRPFQLTNFNNELEILYSLSCEIFSDNYFYSPISKKQFTSLYAASKAIIDPNLIWFCQDKHRDYAGFMFCFPDYATALTKMNGKTNLWAKIKFLFHKNKADHLNAKTLGTVSQYRGEGIGPALLYKCYSSGLDLGFSSINMCLMHEDNASEKMDKGTGGVFRNYHLYQYAITP